MRPLDLVEDDGPPLLVNAIDAGAELGGSVGDLMVLEGPAEVAGSEVEESAGALVGQGEHAAEVDHDLGDGGGLEGGLAEPDVADQVVGLPRVRGRCEPGR